jgi:hypothetical protein
MIVDPGTVLAQKSDQIGAASRCGKSERRITENGSQVRVGASCQQSLGQRVPPASDAQVESGFPVFSAEVRVRSVSKKHLQHFRIPELNRQPQRKFGGRVFAVYISPTRNELPRGLNIPTADGLI